MVRVFSAYHYRAQNIHTINDDILASCLMDSNHIILAKTNHIIEILSLNDDVNHNEDAAQPHKPIQSISFPTVDYVQRMTYCKQGNTDFYYSQDFVFYPVLSCRKFYCNSRVQSKPTTK